MRSAAFGPQWLDAHLAQLLPDVPDPTLVVALSGGVDSVVLLAALASIRRSSRRWRALRAIHVHHGLSPNADRWSRHCAQLCARLDVPLTVRRVKVVRERGDSLEAAAREARYAALGAALKPGEVLLTAHHQDDQLETVLLQLLRGAGIPGLAAMPECTTFANGWLARPLLTRSRAELEAWAREQKLTWVEDDSNINEQLDRNYLRHSVLPLIRKRWPAAAAAVSRSARHIAEARRLLESLAIADVERAAVGASLSVQRLRALTTDRRRNALRYWIARSGHRAPDTRQLEVLAGPLLDARIDANPELQWNDTRVTRHADILSIGRVLPSGSEVSPASGKVQWDWRAHPSLTLESGTLALEPDPHGPLDLDRLPERLTVRVRRGGERLRPHPRARARKLKSLLQEARIPPAERERLPLIFGRDALLAVSDRWLDASVQATPSSRHRARLRFVAARGATTSPHVARGRTASDFSAGGSSTSGAAAKNTEGAPRASSRASRRHR